MRDVLYYNPGQTKWKLLGKYRLENTLIAKRLQVNFVKITDYMIEICVSNREVRRITIVPNCKFQK